jgi:hypothetical protein
MLLTLVNGLVGAICGMWFRVYVLIPLPSPDTPPPSPEAQVGNSSAAASDNSSCLGLPLCDDALISTTSVSTSLVAIRQASVNVGSHAAARGAAPSSVLSRHAFELHADAASNPQFRAPFLFEVANGYRS